jgi:serpin B
MRATWFRLGLFAFAVAPGCNGTSTGNPMQGPDGETPQGVKLLRSDLAREAPSVSASASEALGADNRAFGFDLYAKLASDAPNVFISPFSISVALAMIYPGARADTRDAMRNVLHFELEDAELHRAFNATLRALDGRGDELPSDASGDGFRLNLVNQAWGQVDYPFRAEYLDVLAQNYGTGLFGVDFVGAAAGVRDIINGWVADQTEDRIKDLLPEDSLTSDTRLVLTNAIYFKGSWRSKFDPQNTADGTFHAEGAERTVPLMHQTLEADYAQGDGYRVVELPYLSDAVRMLLVLPDAGEFASFVGSFDAQRFDEIRASLNTYSVTLTLPKFSFGYEHTLKQPLSDLGMSQAFSFEADFTGLADTEEHLSVDDVYHQAFVALDEDGTEAAAATAVVAGRDALPPTAEVSFDRPFLFAIYDQPTGEILFLGQLGDPGE